MGGSTEFGTKRQEDSEDGIDIKEFEAKRRKKAGIYDLDGIEKLKE